MSNPLVQQHEKFYFHDGSVIMRAENTLYNVYRRTLGVKSLFFSSMFSLPPTTGANNSALVGSNFVARREHAVEHGLEGGSDDKAIPLPHAPIEIDAFFEFIFNEQEWTAERPSIQGLCAVLKLSTFYLVDSGRNYSIHHLSSHPDLGPALRLHLACQYNIEDWVGVAFRKLMTMSILSVKRADEELMGHEAFRTLVRAQATVALHRSKIAFGPAKAVHDTDCIDNADCGKTWNEAWWGGLDRPGILTALLHPVMQVPGAVIDEGLSGMKVDWGMSTACRLLTISSFQGTPEKPGRLRLEDEIVAKAIAGLIKQM